MLHLKYCYSWHIVIPEMLYTWNIVRTETWFNLKHCVTPQKIVIPETLLHWNLVRLKGLTSTFCSAQERSVTVEQSSTADSGTSNNFVIQKMSSLNNLSSRRWAHQTTLSFRRWAYQTTCHPIDELIRQRCHSEDELIRKLVIQKISSFLGLVCYMITKQRLCLCALKTVQHLKYFNICRLLDRKEKSKYMYLYW